MFKVGDKFIVTSLDSIWNLERCIGKVYEIRIIKDDLLYFEAFLGQDNEHIFWKCPIECARKVSKLDQALK